MGRMHNEDVALEEIKVGDSVYSLTLLGWDFLMRIPQLVADFWIITLFAKAWFSREGWVAGSTPIKNWEKGVGIVVGAETTLPGEEKLILLYRPTKSNEARLYRSKKPRPKIRGG